MKILLAIFGTHTQPEHRAAQRETWLKDLPDNVDYRYILGELEHEEPRAEEPNVIYCPTPDGPLWDPEMPSSRTWILCRKAEYVAHYAEAYGYDYVFKCDDDTYLHVPRWLGSGFEEHDYSGSTDKHYAKAIGFYRWAQGGAGYWISARAIELIVEHGLHLARTDDFAIGQLLATHNIHPFHDQRYIPAVAEAFLDKQLQDRDWITLHKINPVWMRRLYARFAPAPVAADTNSATTEPDTD